MKRIPSKRNPAARFSVIRASAAVVVKVKKGKGAYRRRPKHRAATV